MVTKTQVRFINTKSYSSENQTVNSSSGYIYKFDLLKHVLVKYFFSFRAYRNVN